MEEWRIEWTYLLWCRIIGGAAIPIRLCHSYNNYRDFARGQYAGPAILGISHWGGKCFSPMEHLCIRCSAPFVLYPFSCFCISWELILQWAFHLHKWWSDNSFPDRGAVLSSDCRWFLPFPAEMAGRRSFPKHKSEWFCGHNQYRNCSVSVYWFLLSLCIWQSNPLTALLYFSQCPERREDWCPLSGTEERLLFFSSFHSLGCILWLSMSATFPLMAFPLLEGEYEMNLAFM